MKQILTFILSAVTIFNLIGDTISYQINFSGKEIRMQNSVDVNSMHTEIQWEGMDFSGEDGAVALPAKYISFAIPCTATNVTIENVQLDDEKEIRLEHPVSRINNHLEYTDEYSLPQPQVVTYIKIQEEPVTIVANENFQNVSNILTVKISPLTYDESNKVLKLSQNVCFEIKYDNLTTKLQAKSEYTKYTLEDLSIVQSLVVNPEILDSETKTVRQKMAAKSAGLVNPDQITVTKNTVISGIPAYEYVVITNRELAPTFEKLVSLKKIQGFDAGVVCIEDILSNENFSKGDTISKIYDDAGKLRRYLYFAHKNGTRYALLGGKPPIVPIRYGYQSVLPNESGENDVPSDLYFSNLNSNWNANGNSKYGDPQDGVEYTPQIYVGRLLCKSKQEVINYLNKLEIYSFNPGFGDYSYLKSGFIHFSYGFFKSAQTDSLKIYHSKAAEIILPSIRKHIPQLTESYQNLGFPYGKDIITRLRANKYGYISIISHGVPEGISVKYYYPYRASATSNGITAIDGETVNLPLEKGNSLEYLSNFKYPSYSYTAACTTMPFDSPKYNNYGMYQNKYDSISYNFGESYTLGQNYGGIAYLGYTRASKTSDGPILFTSFFENLYKGRENSTFQKCGVSEAVSKIISQTPSVGHYNRLSHNLLGDPAVYLWNDEPIVSENYKIERLKNTITIRDINYNGIDRNKRLAIAIEPDGTVQENRFSYNETTFLNISPSSLIYVVEDGYKPYISDAYIQNATYNKNQYFHVNSLTIGEEVAIYSWKSGPVVIDNNTTVTFESPFQVRIKKGTVIKSGATLNICTRSKCVIEDVTIEKGGVLNVYASSYQMSDIYPTCDGNIYIYDDNKYNERKINLLSQYPKEKKIAAPHNASDYRLLLELDKEWRYNIHDFGPLDLAKPDEKMVLRIDSCFEANGITYYRLREYWNDSSIPAEGRDATCEYLWEDTETRTVWYSWKINEDGNPIYKTLLYDFINPNNSLDIYCPENGDVLQFEAFDGMHRAYAIGDGDRLLAEGLGVISYSRSVYDEDQFWCVGTLLSSGCATPPDFPPCASFNCRRPVLYEIADGNGEVIYSAPSAYPHIENGLLQPSSVSKATFTETEIRIASDREIGTVTIMSASGATVLNAYVTENQFRYSIESLAPGIYLLTHGGATKKFVVR